eukprot:gnl/TRDRNA2_/TRDRNA2_80324_c0_seq2.p1 gnl/TRDRNA2_/TRDRNA2_80324_c0~~gnl/TRDRNA2_/TRDRNA2_80324_c0_seq2.p1  ORF type:complete len:1148 (+),score=227.30 gnl/TRDRNA2_/TRDRNA2_80324_c0_seq2:24-3446(+)
MAAPPPMSDAAFCEDVRRKMEGWDGLGVAHCTQSNTAGRRARLHLERENALLTVLEPTTCLSAPTEDPQKAVTYARFDLRELSLVCIGEDAGSKLAGEDGRALEAALSSRSRHKRSGFLALVSGDESLLCLRFQTPEVCDAVRAILADMCPGARMPQQSCTSSASSEAGSLETRHNPEPVSAAFKQSGPHSVTRFSSEATTLGAPVCFEDLHEVSLSGAAVRSGSPRAVPATVAFSAVLGEPGANDAVAPAPMTSTQGPEETPEAAPPAVVLESGAEKATTTKLLEAKTEDALKRNPDGRTRGYVQEQLAAAHAMLQKAEATTAAMQQDGLADNLHPVLAPSAGVLPPVHVPPRTASTASTTSTPQAGFMSARLRSSNLSTQLDADPPPDAPRESTASATRIAELESKLLQAEARSSLLQHQLQNQVMAAEQLATQMLEAQSQTSKHEERMLELQDQFKLSERQRSEAEAASQKALGQLKSQLDVTERFATQLTEAQAYIAELDMSNRQLKQELSEQAPALEQKETEIAALITRLSHAERQQLEQAGTVAKGVAREAAPASPEQATRAEQEAWLVGQLDAERAAREIAEKENHELKQKFDSIEQSMKSQIEELMGTASVIEHAENGRREAEERADDMQHQLTLAVQSEVQSQEALAKAKAMEQQLEQELKQLRARLVTDAEELKQLRGRLGIETDACEPSVTAAPPAGNDGRAEPSENAVSDLSGELRQRLAELEGNNQASLANSHSIQDLTGAVSQEGSLGTLRPATPPRQARVSGTSPARTASPSPAPVSEQTFLVSPRTHSPAGRRGASPVRAASMFAFGSMPPQSQSLGRLTRAVSGYVGASTTTVWPVGGTQIGRSVTGILPRAGSNPALVSPQQPMHSAVQPLPSPRQRSQSPFRAVVVSGQPGASVEGDSSFTSVSATAWRSSSPPRRPAASPGPALRSRPDGPTCQSGPAQSPSRQPLPAATVLAPSTSSFASLQTPRNIAPRQAQQQHAIAGTSLEAAPRMWLTTPRMAGDAGASREKTVGVPSAQVTVPMTARGTRTSVVMPAPSPLHSPRAAKPPVPPWQAMTPIATTAVPAAPTSQAMPQGLSKHDSSITVRGVPTANDGSMTARGPSKETAVAPRGPLSRDGSMTAR